MAGPIWARWVFALLFAGIGVYYAARRVAQRRPDPVSSAGDRASDAAHVLMAAGMTVMFLPVATPIPPRWWAAVFVGGYGLWLALRPLRPLLAAAPAASGTALGWLRGQRHLITHVLAGLVMAYMFAVMPADGLSGSGLSHAGHLASTSAVFAVVGWLAAAYFLGHAVWCGMRMAVPEPLPAPAAPDASGRVDAGRVEAAGRCAVSGAAVQATPPGLLMGLGMAYMLMTML